MSNVDVLSGPEPLRRAWVREIAAKAGREGKTRVVSETAEQALEALDSLSWSPLLVHLKDYDTYPSSTHKALKASLETTSHDVLIEADKITKTQEAVLPPRANWQKISSSGQGYRQALKHCAQVNGVTLETPALDYLARHASAAAAVSTITALASANISPATPAHVRALAVIDTGGGLPWLLLEAIETNNPRAVEEHSEALETPALTAYLGKRLVAAACLSENTTTNLELHTGGLTDSARKQATQWARDYPRTALMEAISACAKADQLAKSGHSSEALALAIGAYSRLVRSRVRAAPAQGSEEDNH